jgi:chemotaxis protein MotB
MSRRKRSRHAANHDRWLISYADFITLLFAFFVVMFASSQADKGKAQQVSDSVKKALEGESVSQVIAAMINGAPVNVGKGALDHGGGGAPKLPEDKGAKLAELLPSLKVLTESLKKEIEAGQIQISMESRGLVISFTQAALFPSGEDVVAPEAYSGLQKVAEAISKIPNPVRLEGHTDSVPIKTIRFRSNWDLSAARSIALLELLSNKFGVPRDRLSIAGYAETSPVASNETEEGRSKNRRVDIVVLNGQGILGEPAKTPIPGKSPE